MLGTLSSGERSRWAGRCFAAVALLSLVVLFSPRTPGAGGVDGLDKLVHAGLFGALAASTRWRFGRGLLLVLGYAAVSELLQAMLPISRDGDPLDVVADCAGALLGWTLVRAGRHPVG